MEPQLVRETYKEKLRPTPTQERALDEALWRCRELYNAALEQRITAYQRRHITVSRFEQEAELKAIRAEFPEYAAAHSHILQDVLARLDKTCQAFFRRVRRGEKAGFPRFKGRNRFHSFIYKQYGNGARLDNVSLVLSKIGRISVHWSCPIEGTPKTVTISREADGWYVAISCADVPMKSLPPTGQETGIDLGLESFATLAHGQPICTPATTAMRRRICAVANAASPAARKAATDDAKPSRCSPKRTSTSPGSAATSTTRKHASSSKRTM
jgi:putative transposase